MCYGLFMNLQKFSDGDGNNGGNNGSNSGNNGGGVTYSFEQAEQIANERAGRAEKSALTNFFQQNGMTAEQAAEAFKDFKAKQEAQKPNVSAIEQQRDAALAELASIKNKAVLSGLGVQTEFTDFLVHEISKSVTDKKDFEACAKEYLKDKPQYTRQNTQFRMSSGSNGGNGAGASGDPSQNINAALRKAFGR